MTIEKRSDSNFDNDYEELIEKFPNKSMDELIREELEGDLDPQMYE